MFKKLWWAFLERWNRDEAIRYQQASERKAELAYAERWRKSMYDQIEQLREEMRAHAKTRSELRELVTKLDYQVRSYDRRITNCDNQVFAMQLERAKNVG